MAGVASAASCEARQDPSSLEQLLREVKVRGLRVAQWVEVLPGQKLGGSVVPPGEWSCMLAPGWWQGGGKGAGEALAAALRAAREHPEWGRQVAVGGRRLDIPLRGPAGSPMIFEGEDL